MRIEFDEGFAQFVCNSLPLGMLESYSHLYAHVSDREAHEPAYFVEPVQLAQITEDEIKKFSTSLQSEDPFKPRKK